MMFEDREGIFGFIGAKTWNGGRLISTTKVFLFLTIVSRIWDVSEVLQSPTGHPYKPSSDSVDNLSPSLSATFILV